MLSSQDDPTRQADLKLRTIEEEDRRKTWRKVVAIKNHDFNQSTQ